MDDLKNKSEKLKEQSKHQLIIINEYKSSLETLKIEKSVLETEVIMQRYILLLDILPL